VWVERLATVEGESTGIFYPLVTKGSYVEQGARVGYVTDYVGRTVSEAARAGRRIVLYVRAVPSLNKGDTIASIGVVKKGGPD